MLSATLNAMRSFSATWQSWCRSLHLDIRSQGLPVSKRGVGFRSLTEGIDTTTAAGKLVFHIFAALAEFEREIIRERTNTGLVAARTRGPKGGRRPKLTPAKLATARQLYEAKAHTMEQIAEIVGVSRATLYRRLEPTGQAAAGAPRG